MVRFRASSLWPIGGLALATLVLTWPTARVLASHVVDRQDPLLNTWIMAWEAHQLLQAPLRLFDANIFFPYRNTLAFSEILLSITVLILPLRWAGLSALSAYNLAFLLAFFSTALGGYLLATALTGRRAAGFLAAVAFAFHPYRYGHLSQIQLLATGWLPLTLLYLDRCLEGRRPLARQAALLSLFFVLQALASFYAAFFAATACLVYAVGWHLVRRTWPSRQATKWVALAAAGAVAVLSPFAWPYVVVNRTLGAAWTLQDNEQFSASLQAYLYAPPKTLVWGPLTQRFAYIYGPCCPPDYLFPGVTLLVLSGVALWRARDRRRWVYAALVLVGFLLSLGPTLHVRAGVSTGIPLPYRWLFLYVPGFQAMRAPVRWALLVTLGLSVLAAWGAARRKWTTWGATLLVLVEFAAVPIRLVEAPRPPEVVLWLAQQPPTRIVELPLVADRPHEPVPADQPRRAWEVSRLLESQYFSTWYWHVTPDGYSGYIPPRHGDWAREMRTFPSARSLATLDTLGVQYVIVYEADFDAAQRQALRERLRTTPRLRLVACFPRDEAGQCASPATRVYALQPAPRQPEPTWRLWATGPLPAGGVARLWLEIRAPGIMAFPTDTRLEVTLRWEGPERQAGRLVVAPPVVVEEVGVVPLEVQVPRTPGEYEVVAELRARNGRLPDPDVPPALRARATVVEAAQAPPVPVPVTLAGVNAERGAETAWRVRLTWRALAPLSRHYSVSVRLVSEDGAVLAQQDGPPGGEMPTVAWQPGTPYGAEWTLSVPAEARPVALHLLWYDPATVQPNLVWYQGAWHQALRLPLSAPP